MRSDFCLNQEPTRIYFYHLLQELLQCNWVKSVLKYENKIRICNIIYQGRKHILSYCRKQTVAKKVILKLWILSQLNETRILKGQLRQVEREVYKRWLDAKSTVIQLTGRHLIIMYSWHETWQLYLLKQLIYELYRPSKQANYALGVNILALTMNRRLILVCY